MNNKSYCKNCGAELKQGDVFCSGCGCAVTAEQTQDSQQYFADNQATAQPVYVTGAGTAAKKKISNKMIGIIFCAFVVLVAIIGIVVVLYKGSTAVSNNNEPVGSNNSIVGTWLWQDGGDVAYEFYEDGTCNGFSGKYYEAAENGELTIFDSYHYPDITYYYKVDGDKLYFSKQSKEKLQKNIENGDYYIRK